MPDYRVTHEKLQHFTWLRMACGLIVTWMLYAVGVRTGVPVNLEVLRIALALWRPGARGA